MDLDAMRIFLKVAATMSFSRAAEQLGTPKSRVTAVIKQLEAELGTRLLHRTTRSVRVTADGILFADRARALVADADELQALFQNQPSGLKGRVRVDMPIILSPSVLIPRLPEFLEVHPLVEIELSSTDRRVDLVREGFDCVVRMGALAESGLVARPLASLPRINVASSSYLIKFGTPKSLEDLSSHRLVRYSSNLGGEAQGWEYEEDGVEHNLPMSSILTVNNTRDYEAAALAGLGLIQAPEVFLREHLATRKLVQVLPEQRLEPLPLTLLYPHREHVARRVQVFMDWLAEIVMNAVKNAE